MGSQSAESDGEPRRATESGAPLPLEHAVSLDAGAIWNPNAPDALLVQNDFGLACWCSART